MRITATVRKNFNKDFKDDNYTWLMFIPEVENRDRDIMMIGRMTTFFDRSKIEYNLKFIGSEIFGIEVQESFFMKFMAIHFWGKKNV
jgi:hypothetical protein